ncbi:putative Gut-specific cysteine proteinase [Blattamonas nauphoetae]|uniref:Gut-specific cysteine proteinase n=1 Tax=Blattamonas nauphoetae TaxID=2049346 RepID=A0ABQ9YHE2_9EUKA|nr:putative Gut-specific cysteine proteinase [Blattamonas nauphoetae]
MNNIRAKGGLPIIPEREFSWEAPPTLPKSFDIRERYPEAVVPVRHQEQCGACWAFATTTAASIRFNIKGHSYGVLSPQDLVSCDKYDGGCNGGGFYTPHVYMHETGATTDQCMSYKSFDQRVPLCPVKCDKGSAIVRHKYEEIAKYTVNDVMEGLMKDGPMYFAFTVYEDFLYHYGSGIYKHRYGRAVNGHAVTLMGWGEENGEKYWLLQNSWGPEWGENGFFRMRRGTNECGCEQYGFISGLVE